MPSVTTVLVVILLLWVCSSVPPDTGTGAQAATFPPLRQGACVPPVVAVAAVAGKALPTPVAFPTVYEVVP